MFKIKKVINKQFKLKKIGSKELKNGKFYVPAK